MTIYRLVENQIQVQPGISTSFKAKVFGRSRGVVELHDDCSLPNRA